MANIVILGTPPARIDATEKMMAALSEAVGEKDLTGFTLFPVKAGYQLSTRRKNEDGWIVKIIPEGRAQEILATLETASGPITAGQKIIEGMTEALSYARGDQTAAARVTTYIPVRPGFEASLDAAAEAIKALTVAIEAWTP